MFLFDPGISSPDILVLPLGAMAPFLASFAPRLRARLAFYHCLFVLGFYLFLLTSRPRPSTSPFEINPFISDKDPYFFYLRCRRFATYSFLDSAPLPEFGEK